MWYSHCEVQMEQIEKDSSRMTTEPFQALNKLQDELHDLAGLRTEIFQLGQTLIQQGTTDIQQDFDEYLRIENETMLKLAQMRISFAQQPEPTSTSALNGSL